MRLPPFTVNDLRRLDQWEKEDKARMEEYFKRLNSKK